MLPFSRDVGAVTQLAELRQGQFLVDRAVFDDQYLRPCGGNRRHGAYRG